MALRSGGGGDDGGGGGANGSHTDLPRRSKKTRRIIIVEEHIRSAPALVLQLDDATHAERPASVSERANQSPASEL